MGKILIDEIPASEPQLEIPIGTEGQQPKFIKRPQIDEIPANGDESITEATHGAQKMPGGGYGVKVIDELPAQEEAATGSEFEANLQAQKAQAAAEQQAQAQAIQEEQAKQAELDKPENWSSTRFKKEAPKPKTLDEQAIYDATLAKKKEQEKLASEKINTPRFEIPKRIIESPLLKAIKETSMVGPVSPGLPVIQGTPGRVLLTPYEQLAKEGLFRIAGATAIPFVSKQIFDHIDTKLGDAFLGYTSPGHEIVKEAMGPVADLPAYAAAQGGPIGSFVSFLEAKGVLTPEKAGESVSAQLLGTQLELMTSPNVLRFLEYPLQVRYRLAAEIFNEIGRTVKKGNLVIDEGQFMKWAESKDPGQLRKILNDIKSGKYSKKMMEGEAPIKPEAKPPVEIKAPKIDEVPASKIGEVPAENGTQIFYRASLYPDVRISSVNEPFFFVAENRDDAKKFEHGGKHGRPGAKIREYKTDGLKIFDSEKDDLLGEKGTMTFDLLRDNKDEIIEKLSQAGYDALYVYELSGEKTVAILENGLSKVSVSGPPVKSKIDEVPAEPKAPRKKPVFNEEKAVATHDRGTLIKIFGGFSYPSHLAGEIGTDRGQWLRSMGKLRRYLNKDAQPLDSLLSELKTAYPHLFEKYETDADLLSAIVSGRISDDKISTPTEKKYEQLEEKFYAEQERLRAEAESKSIPKQDVEEATQQPADLDANSKETAEPQGGEKVDTSFDFSLEADKAAAKKEEAPDMFGGEKSYRKPEFGENKVIKAQDESASDLQKKAQEEKQIKIEPEKKELKKIKHFTKQENIAAILKEGFDVTKPPIHGTGGLQGGPLTGKSGKDVLYFTTDEGRWSKAVIFVGEGKGNISNDSYDYDNNKWVKETNAYKKIDLQPIEAEIKEEAKILTVDSLKKARQFLGGEFDRFELIDKLVAKARREGYDIVNLKNPGAKAWEDTTPNKYGELDRYEELTGGSGKDDYFILNKEILNLKTQRALPAERFKNTDEAVAYGKSLKGKQEAASEIEKMKAEREIFETERKSLAGRENSQRRMDLAVKSQFLREAIETFESKKAHKVKESETMGSPKRPKTTEAPEDPILGTTVNAGDMPMRLDRPPGEVPSTSAVDIMDALAEAVKSFGGKVPFRVGKITKQMKALGIFKVFPEVIRIQTANDIPTAAHELGHALEKLVFGWPRGGPWKNPLVDSKMQDELLTLGRDLYGDRVPNGGYKREGFAEFLRLWLTDPSKLTKKAPVFKGFFEKQFLKDNPEGAKALEKAREITRNFQEQGSVSRVKASIVRPDSIKERLAKLKQDIRNIKKDAIKTHVEMLEPLRVLTEEAERKLGAKLAPEQDPYFTAKALRTTHDARVRVMVDKNMIDISGNPVGAPLSDITALVRGRQEDFTAYLWAKRALALWNDPKRPGGRNPGIMREDAEQIVKELETPKFQLAAQKVYDWNEGVLNYAANASADFKAVVDKIRATDPGYYIPLSREFRDLDNMWARASARSVKAGTAQLSAKLKGSGRRIKDPFPQMISNARAIVKATHNRVVLEQIIKLSKVEGMGHLVEKIPRSQVPVYSNTVSELIDRLNRELGPEAGVTVSGDVDPDVFGQTITFFMPETRPNGKDPVIPIQNNGTLEFYQVDGELFDALASMEVYRLPSIGGMPLLDWIFGKPARVFRAGTTGMRAAFGLITNPLRDLQTLYLNSQANVNAFQLLSAWAKSVADSGFHTITGKSKDPYLNAFIRLGGEMAQPLGQDIPQTRRAARQLFQGRLVKTLDPRNMFDFIRDLFQFPESGARTAELRSVAQQVGWKPGQPMTFSQSLQLLLAAKEVTTDFTAAGELSRVINQIVPFYNAGFQGPRANIRAARRNSKKFLLRGLLALTIPTLLLWNKHKDEEWYQELPAREKFTFWYFPIKIKGQDVLIRIPRSFEVGQFFASMPEAFLDAFYRQNPEAAEEWYETFMEVSNPISLPVLLEESFKQAANKDFYWDRPIVPARLEKMPQEEQFDEYTSRLSITLGDIFNVSPKRIDHAITGLFGNVAGDIIQTLGLGPKGVDRDSQPADVAVIGTLFKRGGLLGTSPKSVNKMYDLMETATNKQYSKKNPETEDDRKLRLMLTDATKAVSAILYVRSQTKETKQQFALTKEATEIARDVIKRYAEENPWREDFKSSRKRYEDEKKWLKDA